MLTCPVIARTRHDRLCLLVAQDGAVTPFSSCRLQVMCLRTEVRLFQNAVNNKTKLFMKEYLLTSSNIHKVFWGCNEGCY